MKEFNMRIGVMSDSHDDQSFIERALRAFQERGAHIVFHCGDLVSAEMIPLFEGFELYLAQGNMDIRPDEIQKVIKTLKDSAFYGRKWEGTLAGKRVAFCHGDNPSLLRELLWRQEFDYVFHGHTHHPRDERIGRTRVVNPGAYNTQTVCVVNLTNDLVEFIELR